MTKPGKPNATKPYTFHGAVFSEEANGQAIGDCPLCFKPKHFHVNLVEKPNPKKPGKTIDAGAFDCKHCGAAGGVYQFLTKFLDKHLATTTEAHYKSLSKLRNNLPWQAFQLSGLAYDGVRWLVPLHNFSEDLRNLYAWNPLTKSPKLLSTPSPCTTSLYWSGDVAPPQQPNDWPIILCEGEWDAIALEWLRREVPGKTKPQAVIMAVHGATTFDTSLLKYFDGRRVLLPFDRDEAGEKGLAKVGPLLLKSGATSVDVLDWSMLEVPADAEKWDLRDQICQDLAAKIKPKPLWESIIAAHVPLSSSGVAASIPETELPKPKRTVKTCDDFRKIIKGYRDRLHLTDNMVDGIAVMFATAFAGRTYGDPLWLFVVGPPGGGKSAIIKSFREAADCCYTSTFKARALVSGAELPQDISLLAQWPQQAVFVKDFTAVKSLPQVEQEEIYGILRDAYDGQFHRQFGNGVERIYNDCYFSLIAGVTDVIHGDQRAELGERFLKFDWIRGAGYNPIQQMEAAIASMEGEKEGDDDLISTTCSFMQREFDYQQTPQPPRLYVDKLLALAQVVALLRTRRPHGARGREDLAYRLRAEVPTRIIKQLSKLGRCLCFVLGLDKWTPRVYQMLYDVALDTCHGQNQEIFIELSKRPATVADLRLHLRFSRPTIERRLDEMVEIGYIGKSVVERPKATLGPPTYSFTLTTESKNLWQTAQP